MQHHITGIFAFTWRVFLIKRLVFDEEIFFVGSALSAGVFSALSTGVFSALSTGVFSALSTGVFSALYWGLLCHLYWGLLFPLCQKCHSTFYH
jgi:hypothetical protein